MPTPEIITRNAIIERAEIVYDMSSARVEISLYYGSASQQVGPVVASQALLYQLLKISHANLWSEIVGKPVRVKCTSSKVFQIGDFLTNDWIDLDHPEDPIPNDDMPY